MKEDRAGIIGSSVSTNAIVGRHSNSIIRGHRNLLDRCRCHGGWSQLISVFLTTPQTLTSRVSRAMRRASLALVDPPMNGRTPYVVEFERWLVTAAGSRVVEKNFADPLGGGGQVVNKLG